MGGWSLYFIFSISFVLGMAIGGFLCFATFIRMATPILSLSDLRLTACQRLSYESVLFRPWHLQGGCSWRNLLRWGGSWTRQVLLFTNSFVTLGLIVWHLVAYWGAKDSHAMLFSSTCCLTGICLVTMMVSAATIVGRGCGCRCGPVDDSFRLIIVLKAFMFLAKVFVIKVSSSDEFKSVVAVLSTFTLAAIAVATFAYSAVRLWRQCDAIVAFRRPRLSLLCYDASFLWTKAIRVLLIADAY